MSVWVTKSFTKGRIIVDSRVVMTVQLFVKHHALLVSDERLHKGRVPLDIVSYASIDGFLGCYAYFYRFVSLRVTA